MTQRVVNYTYGTGNPVLPDGSIDVRDGIDNLQSFDIFMNADEDTYNQRDGEIVRTVAGMNNEFEAQILNMGFTRIGTFAAGATLTNPRQTLLWDIADGGDGQEYGWSGAFPKVVPATSTPASTGGFSVGAWISRFDPELRIQVREALRRSYAEVGYNLVAGSFEAGGTLVNVNDALLHESSGLAYKWGGAFQKAVPPNSTPATTGGVSSAGWLSLGDITLRDEVQQRLDTADANTAAFKANNGFNLVGRLLNLTTLKSALPTTAGDIVFVTSAASTTASEKHYGGGFFQAFDNSSSPISDDGGVHIIPTTGTLGWKRINFTELDMTFWGVKPDSGIDNSAEIMKAMSYVRTKKTTIRFPAGVVTSTQALPIWSECAIVGHGREVSQFVKTTNNGWPVASGVNIDALCVCLPDVYNPSGYTMDTFCIRPRIKGISLRRGSFTFANRSAYGIWGHKLAQAHFSDMLVLAGNYGFYSINCFLMIQEQVSYSGVQGSYVGVYVANTLTGSYGRSGTTCNFTQVGVGGYNFGFFMAGLDSTRLTQCDVEAISRASGEAQCVGYAWINPMNCTMANCYTEDVDGPQLTVTNANTISIANSLVVDNFNMTPPNQAFTQPTPLMAVDAAGLGSLKVTFVGGDLRFAVAGTNNMMPPEARGANCKVTILGGFTNAWSALAGGVVTEL